MMDEYEAQQLIEKNPELKKELQKELQEEKERSRLICFNDVEPQDVQWLSSPRLPQGKVVGIIGDPAAGKTFLMCDTVAAITTGKMPFGEVGEIEPGNCIYQSNEDGLRDTIVPRMIAAGADLSKVFMINESQTAFSLGDVEELEKIIQEINPRLIVLDPIQAFIGRDVDFHRANEVRPILARLGMLAEKYACTVAMIMHMNKAPGNNALYRSLGSIDIIAACRSVMVLGLNPRNPEERVLSHIKSSLAPKGKNIAFTITDGKVNWLGETDVTTEDVLNGYKRDKEYSALDEAVDFLEERLKDGPVSAKEIKDDAKAYGISEITLRRAREKLKVGIFRKGFQGEYHWKLNKVVQFPTENNKMSKLERNPVVKHITQPCSLNNNGNYDDQGWTEPVTEHISGQKDGEKDTVNLAHEQGCRTLENSQPHQVCSFEKVSVDTDKNEEVESVDDMLEALKNGGTIEI